MSEMHHLKVGCADCTVIKSAYSTYLIDCSGIGDYSHLLPSSRSLRAVFITHQHYDHFDGLKYLKENGYSIEYLIYSPYDRRTGDNSVAYDEWRDFSAYCAYFKSKGTKMYSPYRQTNFDEPWWDIDGIRFYILGPALHIAKSQTRELHDACLVIHTKLRNRSCLFTGDASDINLKYIADNTVNICNDILHASHHGSINGADLTFIKACKAQFTVISTESGKYDNVPHPTAMQRYRDNTTQIVYRTDVDGSIKWGW